VRIRNSYEVSKRERRKVMYHLKSFLNEEEGVTVVEIILILVVLIALVLIFKEQLTNIVKTILQKVTNQSNSV
jgi:Flp pilus assembly pilin Flp